jgi:Putative Na+/H+ antiporter
MLPAGVQLVPEFPLPLSSYPPPSPDGLLATLVDRAHIAPFNVVATAIFFCAILHTFLAARVAAAAHHVQHRHDEHRRALGLPPAPNVRAELLHFLGEVEVVFGLWAVVLLVSIQAAFGWDTATHYLNDTVDYTEALFVIVIMALAASRPIVLLAENSMRGGSAARLVHYRARGHDHLRAAAGAAVLRPRAHRAPEVRDARSALRERVDWRNPDAICRAAGPDGGQAVELGPSAHADALRLEGRVGCDRLRPGLLPGFPARVQRTLARARGPGSRSRRRRRRCRPG